MCFYTTYIPAKLLVLVGTKYLTVQHNHYYSYNRNRNIKSIKMPLKVIPMMATALGSVDNTSIANIDSQIVIIG